MDFTLKFYSELLDSAQIAGYKFITFYTYLSVKQITSPFIICRHDVDRDIKAALSIAKLENNKKISASYYFREKDIQNNSDIIKQISNLNHEIGYHYESLAKLNGNFEKAFTNFYYNVDQINKIRKIDTICMHGSPLSKYNNMDLIKTSWDLVKSELNLKGDLFLDIDYKDIAYITDTGRNWSSDKNNVRDKVISNIEIDIDSSRDLLYSIRKMKYDKIVLQTHPERWTNNILKWIYKYLIDCSANILKRIVNQYGIYHRRYHQRKYQ